ncbi:DUF4242 domain-containing protein [bacterium]|nr:DUF4242 domain-containing protein [bacterium]
MQMFMDVHPGLGDATPEDVADAHKRDLAVQDKHGVRYLTYWFNDPAGKAFCLVEAPTAEAVAACHKESHGLMPTEIIPVDAPTIGSFLGEWYAGEGDRAMLAGDPVPDSGLRAIMFTDIVGSTDMSTSIGDRAALEAVRAHDAIVRDCLTAHSGREVKHTGDGVLASFTAVTQAADAAVAIQANVAEVDGLAVKIGLSAGEPVEDSDDLYGAAVNLAARICAHAEGGQILVSGTVRDLAIGKQIRFEDQGLIALKGFPDPVRLYAIG